jgi:hypothetical protein
MNIFLIFQSSEQIKIPIKSTPSKQTSNNNFQQISPKKKNKTFPIFEFLFDFLSILKKSISKRKMKIAHNKKADFANSQTKGQFKNIKFDFSLLLFGN